MIAIYLGGRHIPYKDLREYLDASEKEGKLKKVDCEVDWNLEAGAIVRRISNVLVFTLSGYLLGYKENP